MGGSTRHFAKWRENALKNALSSTSSSDALFSVLSKDLLFNVLLKTPLQPLLSKDVLL